MKNFRTRTFDVCMIFSYFCSEKYCQANLVNSCSSTNECIVREQLPSVPPVSSSEDSEKKLVPMLGLKSTKFADWMTSDELVEFGFKCKILKKKKFINCITYWSLWCQCMCSLQFSGWNSLSLFENLNAPSTCLLIHSIVWLLHWIKVAIIRNLGT